VPSNYDRAAGDGSGGADELTLGFIPLVDCAPLVVAAEMGFAEREGFRLRLVRETSWANIRDRVMLGHFDGAHMLGPMPIAATLGIAQLEQAMVAPIALGLGGNAITLSQALFGTMKARAGVTVGDGPAAMGKALAKVVEARREADEPPLTCAAVYPFSGHNYELRYWLAASGIDPDADVRITVLPPPFMVDALARGRIDGFCVGEPWSSIAVDTGVGTIVTTKSALWRQSPEKVLGMQNAFAMRHPQRVAALVRALWRAGVWLFDPANIEATAEMLSRPGYVGVAPDVIARSLSCHIVRERGGAPVHVPDFLVFSDHAANFPWRSHALWFYSQMVRWGQTDFDRSAAERARNVYRPDFYRAALEGTDADLPNAGAKVEGALAIETPVASRRGKLTLGPDGFFDGMLFDPDAVEDYIRSFSIPR
jgi:ABC-type nitrate/sulfonate/bicarbonate transport system substrate-binding protein